MVRFIIASIVLLALALTGCSGPAKRMDSVPQPLSKKEAGKLISELEKHIGEPYRNGGLSSKGWDCSGLVRTAFSRALALELPRTSEDMHIRGTEIPIEKGRAGDLVFFDIGSKKPSHVGVFLGNSEFIHVSTSSGVIVSSLNEKYYKRHFIGLCRFRWSELAVSR